MERKIIFEKENFSLKKPKHLYKNVFIIYSPWAMKFEPATHMKIDTEVTVFLTQNSKGFLTSIFRGDEINELFHGKHHLWMEILNKSFKHLVKVKRNQPLGFLVIEPENLKFHHEAPKTKKNKTPNKDKISSYRPKTKKASWRFFE